MTLSLHDRSIQGWLGSAAFHVLLFLLLLLLGVDARSRQQDYAEMVLLAAPPAAPGEVEPEPLGTPAAAAPAREEASSAVRLPERIPNRLPPEQVIPVPERRPAEAERVQPSAMLDSTARRGLERRTTTPGSPEGQKAIPAVEGVPGEKLLPAEGVPGSGPASDRPFRIQWVGSSRDLLRSVLPEVPDELDRDVELQFRFSVTPAGEVVSIQPLQRGSPTLEEAAIDALRQWRFKALPPESPQQDQQAVIAIRFRIR
ncbi:MAG: TonB family protein [bacterium]